MKQCVICSNEFKSTYKYAKYCSIECRKIARARIMAEYRRPRLEMIAELKKEYDGCWYCDGKFKGYHLDHIIPRSKGGSDGIENMALACCYCNMAKSNIDVDRFMDWLQRIDTSKGYMFKQGRSK